MFVFKPRKEQVEEQILQTGNPPIDKVLPFNFPTPLRPLWVIRPVQDNIFKVELLTPVTLTGGVDDTLAPFFFHHVVRDFYWFQEDAAGDRSDDSLTWEWGRRLGGDFYIVRAGDGNPITSLAIEDIFYRTDGEEYRFRFEGTATNVVRVQMWVEVLRI